MQANWLILRTGPGPASWNMALDEALLEAAREKPRPVLRLYGWTEPAATFGYSQRYEDVSNWTALRPLIRRPTGGGLVPHDADWTYSIVVPPGHEWYELRAEQSYARAHEWVAASLRELSVAAELAPCCDKELPGRCFIGAEKFDVLANGRKIAGAAQKRNKCGLLIQGSIQPPRIDAPREKWEASFLLIGDRDFEIIWNESQPEESLLLRAEELNREKYSKREYNEKR